MLVIKCFWAGLLLNLPTLAQTTCTAAPSGVQTSPAGPNFFGSFASTSGLLAAYGIPLAPNSGASSTLGDLNSTYFSAFYSITNALSKIATNGNCPFELVLVGTFPQARYFSVTNNDMHYSEAQHLLDADIDPVGTSPSNTYQNPYTAHPWNGTQEYLVPISLGSLPGSSVITGCGINPYETDNLLEATQRHLSMDWDIVLQPHLAPNTIHVVDSAGQPGSNTAGELIVRSYLTLPETCSSGPSSCMPVTVEQPYLMVRDVYTGCAYSAQYVVNHLLAASYTTTPACTLGASCPTAATAIIALGTDPSSSSANWLSQSQQGAHSQHTQVTPQNCYANGDPGSSGSGSPNFYNKVAWVRGSEWVGRPGPDDAYIGGQISPADLQSMSSFTSGTVIRMQFQLPTMPAIPCTGGCSMSGSEPLRYWSLSVVQPSSTSAILENNPDGVDPNATVATTLVSLADTAFYESSGGFVTLLIGVGANMSTLTSGAIGAMQGAMPIATPSGTAYTVYKNSTKGYTYLDLSQFPSFSSTEPLQFVIRNTLPNSFNCSGFAVPFYTAEYTNGSNGAGLMGPYVPLVDYIPISSLPANASTSSANLPSASQCGQLPSLNPGVNGTNATISYSAGSVVQWPTYWPSTTYPAPQSLTCGTQTAATPTIYLATTQWPFSTLASANSCTTVGNTCTNIYGQSLPTAIQSEGQPPLPVTIVGQGFGYLPGNLPYVPPSGSASSPYLEVQDVTAGWDTNGSTVPNCQVYIANWTDKSISLAASAPINASSGYLVPLSLLTDISPLSFFYDSSNNMMSCPIAHSDQLIFTVTNPQTGASVSKSVTVN